MSERRTILIHLDGDRRPSTFDRIVALDSGADTVLSHSGVEVEEVRDIVHGAIFTRGPKHLHRTAIFLGGTDINLSERLLAEIRKHFLPKFGLSVSILMDARGAATTSAAVIIVARKHVDLASCKALVLGTGPVGRRVTRLLARQGADVYLGFVDRMQAEAVQAHILEHVPTARIELRETSNEDLTRTALAGRDIVIAAGPTGKRVLSQSAWQEARPKLIIDLNAVPPMGVEGIEVMDRDVDRNGTCCHGALAVGDLKMKIHQAAIAKLFDRNDLVLDAEELLALP